MINFFKKNSNKITEYKFPDSSKTACFVCDHVLSRQRPILHVTHDYDNYWQFLCGKNDHDESNAKIISIGHATQIDKSINELYEMPIGVGAFRKTVNDKWVTFKLPNEIANT